MPYILIDTAVTGNTTLVPAQGAYASIHVLGLDITSLNTCTVSLYSGTTLLWKTYATTIAGGGIVLPCGLTSELFCKPNDPLILNLSAPVAVAGSVSYTIVGPTTPAVIPVTLNFSIPANSMYISIIL